MPSDLIPLAKAAQGAPGRPTVHALWRWCRRGVLARSGERIRLEHVRAGGRIYTSNRWVREFTKRLAEADTAYFDRRGDVAVAATRRLSDADASPSSQLRQLDEQLAKEGM